MAAITSSAVTVLEASVEGTRSDKERGILLRLAVVLSSQGATSGDIPASVLGLAEIYWAWSFGYNTSGSNNQASVTIDATTSTIGVGSQSILTYTAGSATPANLTGTILLEVFGRSL
jgi:hypothetical protein